MARVEEVALYAVLLRSCARNKHLGPDSLFEDIECGHDGGLSFAQMVAHGRFTDLDWAMVRALDREANCQELARELYGAEEVLGAEALLHAVGEKGKRCRSEWAAPFRERWQAVRKSMAVFEAEIAMTHEQISDLADEATMAATGLSLTEVNEQFGSRWDDSAYLDELLAPFLAATLPSEPTRQPKPDLVRAER